ncbi:adenylyltransferase/cytidyltransferase family protein [Flavobacteriaceae bacterium]|nr:adenylyltransferase/cytidyltransferase family protein [Flavobacteriaceae bacterium]
MEDKMKKKVVIVSGYFNPLHKGHLEYFRLAKKKAEKLYVIVNNDYQRKLKGSKEFMKEDERLLIINELKIVDHAIISIDRDRTVRRTLGYVHEKYSNSYKLIFANGGDQNNENIPEADICKKLNIKLIDGLGKKIQSSSWLINK